ncbi:lamin tail domain-containing protein [Actinoplanes sp. CA-030573]|uniref:lamin tail domain-containing protein n=1 Tax=Actinoplanes sp. CA-030573 TaxID=3239898 RepID=UPI003D8C29AD
MNGKRVLLGLAIVTATTAGVGIAATAEAATPPLTFTRVYYNSPGTDDRSNASLNAEYFKLTNNTSAAIQLAGWTVRDKANHVYTFKSTALAAKASVYVHTGKGSDTATNKHWGSGNYIWNNDGDTATLKNTKATTIDTCTWGRTGSATNC